MHAIRTPDQMRETIDMMVEKFGATSAIAAQRRVDCGTVFYDCAAVFANGTVFLLADSYLDKTFGCMCGMDLASNQRVVLSWMMLADLTKEIK